MCMTVNLTFRFTFALTRKYSQLRPREFKALASCKQTHPRRNFSASLEHGEIDEYEKKANFDIAFFGSVSTCVPTCVLPDSVTTGTSRENRHDIHVIRLL